MSNVLFVLLLCLIHNKVMHLKRIEDIATCLNETECKEPFESETYAESTIKGYSAAFEESLSTIIENTSVTNEIITATQPTTKVISTSTPLPRIAMHNKVKENSTILKREHDVCECDLTISLCDINCCCDMDCEEFHLTAFSHCEDHHAELYDRRYCYNRNFIERNNTPFILEKLANNLFCILYDNLPPTYTTTTDLEIKQYKDLKHTLKPNRLRWKWKIEPVATEYSASSPYLNGDIIWKLEKNNIKPIELLQSGFTRRCSFKKKVKYLQNWKDSCMQTELTNTNIYLFSSTFNNFTVISSPSSFNETHIKLSDQIHLKNISLPLISHYCHNSWSVCNKSEKSGSCKNGMCRNIVTGVKYVMAHNGSMGIISINVYFNIGNITGNFYQYFEVVYKWYNANETKSFTLSGNPGYINGKPLIIGRLKVNKTGKTESQYISFNRTDSFLTLPLAQKDGECSKFDRYTVAFGEDVKLKCYVSLKTNNFTATTCTKLQNDTMYILLKDSLINITETRQYSIYTSKLGNFTNNSTDSWVQILLDRVPQNIVTGQMVNDQIRCSGLITSINFDILYSALSKPETLTNYNILGIGITFSEEIDKSWSKCVGKNCTDILKVDVISYVTFHDVSKPSKYYFVGGPNLDITLPYDFFYPFLSNSARITLQKLAPVILLSIILRVLINILFNYL